MIVAGTSVQIAAELLTRALKFVLSEAFWRDANVSERGPWTSAVAGRGCPTCVDVMWDWRAARG